TRTRARRSSRSRRRAPLTTRAHRAAFGGRGPEIAGLAIIVVGAIAGLAVYADGTGRLGEAFDDFAAWSVGLLRYVAPILAIILGFAGLRRSRNEEDSLRIGVGTILLIASVAGILHLTRGQPLLEDPTEELARAGGTVGVVVGGALAALAGRGGA